MLCFDEELLRLTLRGAANQAKKGTEGSDEGKERRGNKREGESLFQTYLCGAGKCRHLRSSV